MMQKIDINCDMGEVLISTGENIDHLFMPYISSCNIATGAHAGDLETMVKLMYEAKLRDVAIGMHPSYVDRENFGRQSQKLDGESFRGMLLRQFEIFFTVADKLKFAVNHIKAHGALYHDLSQSPEKAKIFIEIVKDLGRSIKVYAFSGSPFVTFLKEAGVEVKQEAFADRRYFAQEQLLSRKIQGSCITDEIALIEQLTLMLDNKIMNTNGDIFETTIDTICIHSDTENALSLAKTMYSFLNHKKISIAYH